MALLKAIAPRINIESLPYVRRYPNWETNIVYYAGSVVQEALVDYNNPDSDSDVYFNFYVAKRDVAAGKPKPSQNDADWLLWVSTDPALRTFYTDSDVYDFINTARADFTARTNTIDSDLAALKNNVGQVLGFDSEIEKIKHDIRQLEGKNIIDSLTDSEASHNKVISWDSDNQKFKFITPVYTVNNISPDANGNVAVNFTTTKTGTRDDRPDSDINGTIFIIVGDSDSELINSTAYIQTDTGWVRIIGFTEAENDIRYVNVSGDTMTGNLLLPADPTRDSEAATKRYVDSFNDSDKQDKIIILNTRADLLAYTYEEDRIYYVKEDNTIHLFSGGSLNQFIIPGEKVFNPVMLEASIINSTLTFFDVEVKTYRFSSFAGGVLTLQRNNAGFNTVFVKITNLQGDDQANGSVTNARLIDSTTQAFRIRIPFVLQTSDFWDLKYVTHDGVQTSIRIDGRTNAVAFSESTRSFNFGTY